MAAFLGLHETVWAIGAMNGATAFLLGHQGSYVFAGQPRALRGSDRISLREGARRTNTPLPIFALIWVYHWFGLAPWAFAIWFGFKVGWVQAGVVCVIGVASRLLLTALTQWSGLLRNAWVIAWAGLPLIPILQVAMVWLARYA